MLKTEVITANPNPQQGGQDESKNLLSELIDKESEFQSNHFPSKAEQPKYIDSEEDSI